MLQPDRQRLEHIRDYCIEIKKTIIRYGESFEAFDSDADFQRYVAERVAASAVRIGGAPSSQMWTFSTCSYLLTPENERTVVHCKLVRKSSVG